MLLAYSLHGLNSRPKECSTNTRLGSVAIDGEHAKEPASSKIKIAMERARFIRRLIASADYSELWELESCLEGPHGEHPTHRPYAQGRAVIWPAASPSSGCGGL